MALVDMETFVVKIGSKVLIQPDGKIDTNRVSKIAGDVVNVIKADRKVALIASGAVSAGLTKKGLADEFQITEVSGKREEERVRNQIRAAVGQPELINTFIKSFENLGFLCAQILVTREDFSDRDHYLNLRRVTSNLLRRNIIPVFNENDVLSHQLDRFKDNDQLAYMISATLAASCLILATSVDGVYDRSPSDPESKLIPEINDVRSLIKTIEMDTTDISRGGIESKLESADIVTSLGIQAFIVNGGKENFISRIILQGELFGTYFPINGQNLSSIKTWIQVAEPANGQIIVSTHLAELLRERKFSSILMFGIEEIRGVFSRGDIIEVLDDQETVLGKGQVKYDSESLKFEVESFKNRTEESAGGKKIAIHYDYFVFAH